MTLAVIALITQIGGTPLPMTLKSVCPFVYGKQVEGWSNAAIEQLARDNKVPSWIIRWAKKNC